MRGTMMAGALLRLLMVPAVAQAMTVNEFLAKVAALKAKGMAAMMSPDIGLVRGEVKAAAVAYRAEIDAAQAAGKPPRSCPPPKGQARIDHEKTDRLVPDDSRRTADMSVKAAFFTFMDKRYPCT